MSLVAGFPALGEARFHSLDLRRPSKRSYRLASANRRLLAAVADQAPLPPTDLASDTLALRSESDSPDDAGAGFRSGRNSAAHPRRWSAAAPPAMRSRRPRWPDAPSWCAAPVSNPGDRPSRDRPAQPPATAALILATPARLALAVACEHQRRPVCRRRARRLRNRPEDEPPASLPDDRSVMNPIVPAPPAA